MTIVMKKDDHHWPHASQFLDFNTNPHLHLVYPNFLNKNSLNEKIQVSEICDQVWMAENLGTTRYRNGGVIPEAQADNAWYDVYFLEDKSAWCWNDNDSGIGEINGKLYKRICCSVELGYVIKFLTK